MTALEDIQTSERALELALRDVHVRHEETGAELVRGVTLSLQQGSIMGLIGESGSGKTMLCRSIVGALPKGLSVTDGSIGFLDAERRHVTSSLNHSMPVGMVFADPHVSLDPLQKVGRQIAEMASVHASLNRRAARVRALELLGAVAIDDPHRVYDLYPFEISGGMAQRAMIASVLAGDPFFVLADEPTSALDATVQVEILDLLQQLAQQQRVGIVITTHDIGVAARVCDTVGVMYAGRLVEVGPTATVLSAPQHPYTRLLLLARPRGTRGERLVAIPGEPPAAGEIQEGCRFRPRCPSAQEL
jgi:oligopeptide/dipeptide ABC transporter ATP-binding protein